MRHLITIIIAAALVGACGLAAYHFSGATREPEHAATDDPDAASNGQRDPDIAINVPPPERVVDRAEAVDHTEEEFDRAGELAPEEMQAEAELARLEAERRERDHRRQLRRERKALSDYRQELADLEQWFAENQGLRTSKSREVAVYESALAGGEPLRRAGVTRRLAAWRQVDQRVRDLCERLWRAEKDGDRTVRHDVSVAKGNATRSINASLRREAHKERVRESLQRRIAELESPEAGP